MHCRVTLHLINIRLRFKTEGSFEQLNGLVLTFDRNTALILYYFTKQN